MSNLRLVRKRNISPFRRIAIATWPAPGDPSVYGTLELRMDRALEYLAAFTAKTGRRATVTHLVAKAVAAALRSVPEANAVLRFNRLYLREDVSIFFQVAISQGETDAPDLSGLVLRDVDKKSLAEICDEFKDRVEQVRKGNDPALEGTRRTMQIVPRVLLPWVLRAVSFFVYTLNLNPRIFGVPRDAFGSVMISNVGSLGLDIAYPPLVPYSRVPLLLAIGAVKDAPVVENGLVVVGKTMNVSVTFDHRFMDGVHAAAMGKVLRAWIEQPFDHFDPVGPSPS